MLIASELRLAFYDKLQQQSMLWYLWFEGRRWKVKEFMANNLGWHIGRGVMSFKLQAKICIIGSAEALLILCVRYFRWERERDTDRERERERDRERRKWRHHCRAKIGDEFTLSHATKSHNWRWAYTFPCQKFALFVSPFTLPVSPFTERSPLWRWNSQRVHTFHCQKSFRPLCSPSFKWHEPRDEWSKTQDKWSNPAQSYFVLPIEKLNQINTKNYWK